MWTIIDGAGLLSDLLEFGAAKIGGLLGKLGEDAAAEQGSQGVGDLPGSTGGDAVAQKKATFTYDAAGDLTGISRYSNISSGGLVANTTFSYDNAERLAVVGVAGDGEEAWALARDGEPVSLVDLDCQC